MSDPRPEPIDFAVVYLTRRDRYDLMEAIDRATLDIATSVLGSHPDYDDYSHEDRLRARALIDRWTALSDRLLNA